MNLDDLSPAEQRAWIDDQVHLLAPLKDTERVLFEVADLQTLFRLALRALPVVEWKEDQDWVAPDPDAHAYESYPYLLSVWGARNSWHWCARIKRDGTTGTSPSLELAKAAAENALEKVIGGSE